MATLTEFTRTVDLSGKTQGTSLTTSDPELWQVLGTVANTEWFDAGGGQTGFELDGVSPVSHQIVLLSAVPFAAYCEDTENDAYNADSVTVEWEQLYDNGSSQQGGLYFYHFSNTSGGSRSYGTDGAGYYALMRGGGAIELFSTTNGSTLTETVNSAAHGVTSGTYGRFRATLAHTGSGNKSLSIDVWNNGAWLNILSETTTEGAAPDALGGSEDIGDCGYMFAVGFRCQQNFRQRFRGPDGAAGPKVTFKGADLVMVMTGQSELVGRADGTTAFTNSQVMTLNARGSGSGDIRADWVVPATDGASGGWCGSGEHGGHGTNWELNGSDGASNGSWVADFANQLQPRYGNVVIQPCCRGGQAASHFVPPSIGDRYNSTTMGGTHSLMAAMFAGDGQTTGQTLATICQQGTSNATSSALAAAFKGNWDDFVARHAVLWPTSDVWFAVQGDRTFNSSDAADCETVRNAQIDIIANNAHVKQIFDDEQWVGMIGAGNGWPNQDEGDPVHPGKVDNVNIARTAANTFIGGSTRGRGRPRVAYRRRRGG